MYQFPSPLARTLWCVCFNVQSECRAMHLYMHIHSPFLHKVPQRIELHNVRVVCAISGYGEYRETKADLMQRSFHTLLSVILRCSCAYYSTCVLHIHVYIHVYL